MTTSWCPVGLQHEWAKWLACFPWDFFVTLTFKRGTKDSHTALRRACRWSKRWGFARAVYCVELFKHSGDVHLHGLVQMQADVRTQDASMLFYDWLQRCGICRISALSSRKSPYQATLYVAKYCTKVADKFEYVLWGARSMWKNLDILLANAEKEVTLPIEEAEIPILEAKCAVGIVDSGGGTKGITADSLRAYRAKLASAARRSRSRALLAGDGGGHRITEASDIKHDDGGGDGDGARAGHVVGT